MTSTEALAEIVPGTRAHHVQPIIRSLLDTDLYKFTMWQAMLHGFPRTRRNTASSAATAGVSAGRAAGGGRTSSSITVHAHVSPRKSSPTWRPALHQERLRRLPAHLPFPAALHHGEHRGRHSSSIVARGSADARDGLRDLRAGHRQRAVLPALRATPDAGRGGRRRLQRQDRAAARFRRRAAARRHPFEFFDFGMRRRFSREWHEEVVATLAREVPQYFKGTSNVYLAQAVRPGAHRHHGPRVSADLPGVGRAAAATSRGRRWKTGCRSIAATWAWR